MLLEHFGRFFERGALAGGDQRRGGHDLFDNEAHVGNKAHIAVGNDPNESLVLIDNRNA